MSKVRVKFLKHVASPLGSWKPNDIAELDKELADQVCKPVKYTDREELFVKAIILESKTAEGELEEGIVKVPLSQLTVGEMVELGVKNVVKTPHQPDHEEYLKKAGFVPTKENDKRRAQRLEKEKLLTETQPSE